ncbi:MAG: ABC transporter ATP-binding protein [Actinomycetota bacterium]
MLAPEDSLVRARGLTKRFGDFTAVDGIDFEVRAGEAFGILGPNGAGKTSAMRMIATTSPVSGGSLSIFGLDPEVDGPAIRGRLGVVSQEDNLDTDLTVFENLYIYGRYFGLRRHELEERIADLLEFTQLADRRDETVDPLSGGMKRRLVIARALLNRPELILLDEPTTGLDPQARHMLWERMWSLKSEGASLLITTHYMDEAEQLCDRLVVMDEGRIVDEGGPRELIERHCTREVIEARYADPDDHARVVAALVERGARHEALADRVLLYTDHTDGDVEWLRRHTDVEPALLIRRSTLEDVFLALTGRTLEEV